MSEIKDGNYTYNQDGTNRRYLGLSVDALGDFVLSVKLGSAFNNSLASRLGEALTTETDAGSRAIARMVENQPHGETVFVAESLRAAYVNQFLLAKANGLSTTS